MQKSERYQYLVKLIRKVTKISGIVYKYQSTPRIYGTEELLYMREAHFIDVLGSGELDMGQIAEKLEVTGGAASQIAARLEKKGYICRKKDPADSRRITCVMTDKARKALAFHREKDRDAYERFEEFMAGFTEEELRVCDRFLENINQFYHIAVDEETGAICTKKEQ